MIFPILQTRKLGLRKVNLYQQRVQAQVEILFPLTLSLHCLRNAPPTGPPAGEGREEDKLDQRLGCREGHWGGGCTHTHTRAHVLSLSLSPLANKLPVVLGPADPHPPSTICY